MIPPHYQLAKDSPAAKLATGSIADAWAALPQVVAACLADGREDQAADALIVMLRRVGRIPWWDARDPVGQPAEEDA